MNGACRITPAGYGRCYRMSGRNRSACGLAQPERTVMRAARLALLAFVLANPAVAGPVPLSQEPHINDELRAGAAGDILRHTCPAITARMLVVFDRLFALRDYALSQGYDEATVRAFLDDDSQKARIKAEAAAYLAKAGAKPGDVESYCKVGRDEIAKNTPLGQLIKASQ